MRGTGRLCRDARAICAISASNMALAPIAFTAALPHGRAALSIDADGEGHLVLAIPASDAHLLTQAWPRLQDCEIHVALVPALELRDEDTRPPRRGGRRRETDREP